MTPVWRLVAEREIRTRLRDKAFLAATGVTLAIVIGLLVFGVVAGSQADRYDLALGPGVDESLAASTEAALVAAGHDNAEVDATPYDDVAAVEQAVRDGDAGAGLVVAGEGYEIIGAEDVDPTLQSALAAAIGESVVRSNAAEADVDLGALYAGATPSVRLLEPGSENADARSGIAFAFALVFFITALTFGMTIAQSVVQEKESRIVEILAAAVPIRSLLWGKILGNTVLAMGQVALLTIVGVVGLAVTSETDLLRGVGPAMLWYVAFFLLGFLTLACLWSVAGSLASRQEDLQSTTLPGQMILLVPYLVAATAGEGVRTVCSMLPVVATMVMPGRMAEGPVPWWQVAIAIGSTIAAAVLFVRVGSVLYERTLLRTSGRISYRRALSRSEI